MVEPIPFGRLKFLRWAAYGAALSGALCPALAVAREPTKLERHAETPRAKQGANHSPGKNGKNSSAKKAAKAAPAKAETTKTEPSQSAPTNPDAPASEPPPPPYEMQALRLAEILGALAYLDDLCGSKTDWRGKMQQFLEAEAKTSYRKERLAGTFNRSFHDYEQSYQVCTPNAQTVIGRFLAEGGKLAHEIVNRFSSS
jgi:uncharacterized protein (TIGR02301 family)